MQDVLDKVALVIIKESEPVEKHVFQMLPCSQPDDESLTHTDEVFRDYFLKFGLSRKPATTSPGSSFSIEVTTNQDKALQIIQSPSQYIFPWVESKKGENETNNSIRPLKTMITKDMSLEMYIETKQLIGGATLRSNTVGPSLMKDK